MLTKKLNADKLHLKTLSNKNSFFFTNEETKSGCQVRCVFVAMHCILVYFTCMFLLNLSGFTPTIHVKKGGLDRPLCYFTTYHRYKNQTHSRAWPLFYLDYTQHTWEQQPLQHTPWKVLQRGNFFSLPLLPLKKMYFDHQARTPCKYFLFHPRFLLRLDHIQHEHCSLTVINA